MKNTYTRQHVDEGGDSTWSMLLEGQKMWILARPELRSDFEQRFPCHWQFQLDAVVS